MAMAFPFPFPMAQLQRGRPRYRIKPQLLTQFVDTDCGLDVVVVTARTPFSMVVHRADKVFELAEVEQSIAEIYLDLDNRYPARLYPFDIERNKCYSLYSQKKRRWVRARGMEDIMFPAQMKRTTMFELVDYADTEVVPANHARFLPDELCALPEMAYKMSLDEAIPNPWPTRINDCSEFRDLVVGKELYCILESHDIAEDETYYVSMYDVDKEDGDNFRDFNETNIVRALPDSAYLPAPANHVPAPVVNQQPQPPHNNPPSSNGVNRFNYG